MIVYVIVVIVSRKHVRVGYPSIARLNPRGARAQKRNKTKSLIISMSRGHAGVNISLRGRRLFKVEKQF